MILKTIHIKKVYTFTGMNNNNTMICIVCIWTLNIYLILCYT